MINTMVLLPIILTSLMTGVLIFSFSRKSELLSGNKNLLYSYFGLLSIGFVLVFYQEQLPLFLGSFLCNVLIFISFLIFTYLYHNFLN